MSNSLTNKYEVFVSAEGTEYRWKKSQEIVVKLTNNFVIGKIHYLREEGDGR